MLDEGNIATAKNDAAVYRAVRERINEANLWHVVDSGEEEQRSHLVSPEPLALTPDQAQTLQQLGPALLAFYNAANDLYLRSGYEWVNDYLDIGKSDDLLRMARMKFQKRSLPRIIRPDILVTDDGFVITELDSVPGGFGQLDCLSSAYEEQGFDLIGSPNGMRDGFAAILRDVAEKSDPICAIVVSEESADYLPEMIYLAGELRKIGLQAYTVSPKEVEFTEDGLYVTTEGERLRLDVVYRFFELFDLLNIPKSELIAYAARKKLVVVTPPYKHYLEEKMLLAFLHHSALEEYWRSSLGEEHFELLKRVVSPTFIFDNRPVPPHAEISGFRWQGLPIRDWREIESGTQKDRRLVLKPSGFSPLAWGARGVKVGHDMNQEQWVEAVEHALMSYDSSPYVLQPFSDTALIGVKYYDESRGDTTQMDSRVRLCPYYFVAGDEPRLGGVLATSCPKNKKLIHGMVDAVMSPCRVMEKES